MSIIVWITGLGVWIGPRSRGCCSRAPNGPLLKGIKMAEAHKNDSGKVRLELHPFDVLESVGWVWTKGAEKYKDRNWERGFNWSRVFGAVLRHLFAWGSGRRVDPEWGYSHLDHALCSLMMLRAHELRG